ncbi:hypothetical protein D0812_20850 [Vibrio owensii]|uniref:Uncharacterized protein n=1 Tax=Vibrio owensii TaxID=696485 RepID=A0AAP9GFK8_9VIBR|nr:hypothetical protein D0812_20850 [Vibrio owensii]NOI70019.1 hypothetical protein [Vibrio owensii]QGH49010.1 hypothetical protein APZ19_17905 [Vibrio owensii]TDE26239.1 hypothetical protein E1100_04735 [Vibrio owensii]
MLIYRKFKIYLNREIYRLTQLKWNQTLKNINK